MDKLMEFFQKRDYYMPSDNDCGIHSKKHYIQVFEGKKKFLKNDEVSYLNVPRTSKFTRVEAEKFIKEH
jgi:hypothetical protein